MNFIFHTLEMHNREINAKKNSTVKDATDAVEKRNPEKIWQACHLFKPLPFLYQCSLLQGLQPLLMSSCYAPPHTWLLRIKPHFFPTVSQLEFSFHFLEGVRATFTVR